MALNPAAPFFFGQTEVSPATETDAAELVRLNALFNGEEEAAEVLAVRLADPRRVETPLLARIHGRVAGFAALRMVPCIFYAEPHAELTELYVEPEFRRQGVGRALVVYAEQMAIEAGAQRLYIQTGDDNESAQALYRGLGYVNDDIVLIKEFND